jgi:hypothetical protein
MAKFWAHGTTVSFDSVAIGGLTSIGLPEPTRGQVDVTDTNSGAVREFVAGMQDAGELTLEGILDFTDAGQAELRTNIGDPDALREVVITLPSRASGSSDVITIQFDAFVLTAPGGTLPLVDETAPTFTATLKVSGAITIN